MTLRQPPHSLVVGAIQQTHDEDADKNIHKSAEEIEKAAALGAKLIVLSELHKTRYFCQQENSRYFDLAEPIPGPSTEFFGQLAARLGVVLVLSLFERRAAGLYHNTAVVIERDGSIAGKYRKMHIPDDPGYYEKFYFTPGDLGFRPIQTSVGSLGVLICWDQWFPEAARLMALAGADLLVYPTAIGWDGQEDQTEQTRQHQAWIIAQRAHAITNGIPVIVCNRVGVEPDPYHSDKGITFWGSSFIAGPQGEMLASASIHQNERLLATLDFNRSEAVRRVWPYLRDRRVDAYHELILRYRDF